MSIRVYLSEFGRSLPPEQARVSVLDRGFLFGDSVYETTRTQDGKPVELVRHLSRLRRSAEAIALAIPWSDEDIAKVISDTHADSGNVESSCRIVVTRGTGSSLMLDPRVAQQPLLAVIIQPLQVPRAAEYAAGLSVCLVSAARGAGLLDASVKSGNYLTSVLALRCAAEQGCDDAILCNDRGEVTEGASSNVFAFFGDALHTPALGCGLLPGITREVVIELARAMGITVIEDRITCEQLLGAEEIFLTSSVRGIMPVSRLEGRSIADGRMGPRTARLLAGYHSQLAGNSPGLAGAADRS